MTLSPASAFDYVTEPAALAALCDVLREAPWVALDTEFERSRTFHAELCLVQIAAPGVLACIDPLALPDLAPLAAALAEGAGPKLLHAARQDLEVLARLDGRLPTPLFDTQVAAGLAGFADNIGYADLVRQLLDITLDKSQTRTDWRQRPLTRAQLDYAAADVLHLEPLAARLREKLASLGRLAWLAEDCAALLDPELYRQAPESAWQRLRGLHALAPVAQARAVALAAWREQLAQSRNLPRGWVLKDDELLAIATAAPREARELTRFAPDNGNLRRHGEALVELLHGPLPEQPPVTRRLTPAGRAALKALTSKAQAIASTLGLASSLLVTRRELEALVCGEVPRRLRDGWRGQALADLLAEPPQGDGPLWE